MVRLEIEYCLVTWQLTFIDGFIKNRLTASLYRISFILRIFFKDIYFEKNFKTRDIYTGIRAKIKALIDFPRHVFSGEELDLLNYFNDLLELKKMAPVEFHGLSYQVLRQN
jgi:hypothetical protein